MKKRDINTLADLKSYEIELKTAYQAGSRSIKSSAKQSISNILPWNVAVNFYKSKMERKIDQVLDVRGQLIPNVAGYILHKTILKKVGFFKRILLSFGAKQVVKHFLKEKKQNPAPYVSLPLSRNNDIINVVKKKTNLNVIN